MINTDRPLSLAEAGRQDVENALAYTHTLVVEAAAIADRTNPAPSAGAPYPNEALYWLATRWLEQLIPLHEALSRRWAAIDALLGREREGLR